MFIKYFLLYLVIISNEADNLKEIIMELKLDTLVDLFGNHYGSGFYLMGTKINDLKKVMDMVDEGFLSPLEIHDLLTY